MPVIQSVSARILLDSCGQEYGVLTCQGDKWVCGVCFTTLERCVESARQTDGFVVTAQVASGLDGKSSKIKPAMGFDLVGDRAIEIAWMLPEAFAIAKEHGLGLWTNDHIFYFFPGETKSEDNFSDEALAESAVEVEIPPLVEKVKRNRAGQVVLRRG